MWSETGPLRYQRLTWPEVARAADRVVLLPAIPHGHDPHHMHFPGAISIGWDTFVRYRTDVGRSLARLVMAERPEVLAAAAFYLASPADKGRALLEATVAECVADVDELLDKPPPERRRPATGS